MATLELYKDLYQSIPWQQATNITKLPPVTITYPGSIPSNSCTKTQLLKKGSQEGTTQVMATVLGGPGVAVGSTEMISQIRALANTACKLKLPEVEIAPEGQERTPTVLYTPAGTKFSIYYFKYSEDSDATYIWIPVASVYTDIANDEEHYIANNFQSVPLFTSGFGRPLVGADTTVQNNYLEIKNTTRDTYENIRVLVFIADTTYKFSNNTTQTAEALFFVVVADHTHPDEQNPDETVTDLGILTTYCSCYTPNILTASDAEPDPDDRDNGYNPTNNFVGNQSGGRGSGNGVSDPAERFDLASRNAAFSYGGRGAGLTYYDMSAIDFYKVMTVIYSRVTNIPESLIGGDLSTALDIGATLYANTEVTRDCVISAIQIPFNPISSPTENIQVGFVNIRASGTGVITERILHVGDFQLSLVGEGWQDYNDIAFTEATLYLPFVGSISIDPAAIAANAGSGGYVEVDVYVDTYNGNIAYWVYLCPMNTPSNVEYLHGVYTGNCAMEIPYAALASTGELKGRIRNIGSSIADGAQSLASTFISGGSYTPKTSATGLEGFR
jgi:hypothetical protein